MNGMSRRDAVKLTAGLAIGAGALGGRAVHSQQAEKAAASSAVDPDLAMAVENPQVFMFSEQVTFKLKGDGHSRDLYITSARDAQGRSERVRVPSASMRIFRADESLDEFTRQGGMYWRFHETDGKAQFKTAGPLVMVVRDQDDTVRCYSLVHDERC